MAVNFLRANIRKLVAYDVVKLFLGTMGGRAISILALPLLTRLYTPADFGLLAQCLAIVTTISVVATLRLEFAIPLSESDADAASLFMLALLSSFSVTIILLLLVLLFPGNVNSIVFKDSALSIYLWTIPFGVSTLTLYATTQYWATRRQNFGLIARTKFSQSCIGLFCMLVMGWIVNSPIGLIIGSFAQLGAGSLRLGLDAYFKDRKLLSLVDKARLKSVMTAHYRYPLYATPEALISSFGSQIPIFLIASTNMAEAGYLYLASQLMFVPMSLLGGAVTQVYVSQIKETDSDAMKSQHTLVYIERLAKFGLGPILFVGVISPLLFPIILGSSWSRTGELVTWMIPWTFLHILCAPVSLILYVNKKQAVALVLQIIGVAIRVGAVSIALLNESPFVTELFITSSTVFYFIYLLVIINISNIRVLLFLNSIISFYRIYALWLVAILVSYSFLKFLF